MRAQRRPRGAPSPSWLACRIGGNTAEWLNTTHLQTLTPERAALLADVHARLGLRYTFNLNWHMGLDYQIQQARDIYRLLTRSCIASIELSDEARPCACA